TWRPYFGFTAARTCRRYASPSDQASDGTRNRESAHKGASTTARRSRKRHLTNGSFLYVRPRVLLTKSAKHSASWPLTTSDSLTTDNAAPVSVSAMGCRLSIAVFAPLASPPIQKSSTPSGPDFTNHLATTIHPDTMIVRSQQ